MQVDTNLRLQYEFCAVGLHILKGFSSSVPGVQPLPPLRSTEVMYSNGRKAGMAAAFLFAVVLCMSAEGVRGLRCKVPDSKFPSQASCAQYHICNYDHEWETKDCLAGSFFDPGALSHATFFFRIF